MHHSLLYYLPIGAYNLAQETSDTSQGWQLDHWQLYHHLALAQPLPQIHSSRRFL
jgi:hypothetical protein